MSAPLTKSEAEELLYREALLLDRADWDGWLALYHDDAVFWLPAWSNETTPTSDPEQELSLIYYQGRRNLEDRVWRLRSRQSVASQPLPRFVHAVTNVLIEEAGRDWASVSAAFIVHRYDVRSERAHAFFGRYEYRIQRKANAWLIGAKKVLLLNDTIPTVLDVYSV
jgi:benzoate/toluate 1,2-dioxygenase beta subunit